MVLWVTKNYVIFDDSLINITERGNATVPMLATTAGLSGAGLLAPAIADKDKPLPLPTAGDVADSLFTILGMPMTGLQGLARGGYGLLTGEDLATAAAEAAQTMDVGWKNGLLDVSKINPDKGADQFEGYVTDVTGDQALAGWQRWGCYLAGFDQGHTVHSSP